MKQIMVIFEYDNDHLGDEWMNEDNLKFLLYNNTKINRELFKIVNYKEMDKEK